MNSIVVKLNSVTERAIGWVAAILERVLPEAWGLFLLSASIGAALALIYGKLVNQEKVKRVKASIGSFINEAILYKHDPLLTLKAQGGLVVAGVRYLGTSLFPLAALFMPSMLLFAALQTYYGYSSISALRHTELTISVAPGVSPFELSVKAAPETALSPPLRVPTARQLIYRISNPSELVLTGKDLPGELALSPLLVARAPQALSASWLESLFFGSVTELPPGIEEVFISKPVRSYSFIGFSLPWYLWSITFILLGGFSTARAFRITF